MAEISPNAQKACRDIFQTDKEAHAMKLKTRLKTGHGPVIVPTG